MQVDYTVAGWELVSRILTENSVRLSRTRQGVSDTSASDAKRPLLLSGEALRRKTVENEEAVHRYIWEARSAAAPGDAAGVLDLVYRMADITNDGLLPHGRLRTWDVPYGPPETQIPAEEVPRALECFGAEVARRWPELEVDPAPLAAWAEWELNAGPLHPFYDGCGRISRSIAAMLLVRAGWLLPLFEDKRAYFRHATAGREVFAAYFHERIEACREWLGVSGR